MVRKLIRLRFAAGLFAIACAAAVLAPAAFAHSSGMSVTATCNTATGQWDLTWKVGPTDYLDQTPKITASNRSSIPVNTSLTQQNTTFTESVAGSTGSVSAALTITWTGDNYTQNVSTSKTLSGGCVQDTGSLKITKALTGGPQGYTGPFDVAYNCGVGHTGTTSVSAGSSKTITGIPLLAVCTVSEPVLPSPPAGYSFGTPTFGPNNGVVTVTSTTTPVEVTVNNTLTLDKGYLKISKVFDAKSSGFVGSFAIHYNCGGGDQSVALAAGGSTTVGPFNTGTSCTVSEPVLPSAPSGWTFGTPVVTGSPATITKGNEAAAVSVTVTNSITRDQGYLKISKVFDAKSSGFVGSFAIHYNCGGGDQSVALAAGGSTTVGPFNTGTSCTVSEPVLPSAPSGWTFGTPVVTGSPATITKGNEAAAVSVTVTNSITQNPPPPSAPKADVTVTKAATPAVQLPLGGGTAPIVYNIVAKNNGPDAAQNVNVSDTAPDGVTFVSASAAKGSCAVASDGRSVQCTLGSLALNETVAITINATVSSTGTKVNTVTVTTTTTETNTGNNAASASTVVTAPVTPPTPTPTPKPKPKPSPEVCTTLVTTPKTVKATGKKQVIKVTVKTGTKPKAGVKVQISGAGISKVVSTGRNGTVKVTIKPSTPGLITLTITGAKGCNTQRIGVVGVYEPPVTG